MADSKDFKTLLIKDSMGDHLFLPRLEELKKLKKSQRSIEISDYAQACGAASYETLPHGKKYGIYFYNKGSYILNSGETHFISTNGMFNSTDANNMHIAICPRMSIDVEKLSSSNNFNFIIDNQGHTITFSCLRYPQTIAPNSSEFEAKFKANPNFATPTGRIFSGRLINKRTSNCLAQNMEYEIDGEQYVRIKVCNNQFVSKEGLLFSDGKSYENGDFIWCKVEPIVWKIINWEETATQINQNSTQNDQILELQASEGLVGGVPYYPFWQSNNKNCELYQNSMIRAFLNGYNIYESLQDSPKMLKDKAPLNFDMEDCGFLSEAFFDENEISSLKDKKSQKLTLDTAPLSIKEQMQFYIKNGKSFMLHGLSGVGKTRRVQELDPDCVTLQLRNGILPEEIIGKTSFDGVKSHWIEPTWYTRLCAICEKEPEKKHILFIDELTNVHANEQSLVYNIVLEHSIDGNNGKLPDNCVVVAAGNNPSESLAAYNMPEPLFRRFEGHIYLRPDLRSFLEWGSEIGKDGNPKIHPLVATFLASNKGNAFYSPYDPDSPPKFAIDPRGWEQISKIIYDNDGILRFELLADKVGSDIATDLIAFARLPQITVKAIMEGKVDVTRLPTDKNSTFALTCSLRNANEKEVRKVRNFIKTYFGRENLQIFDSLWAEENDERALLIGQLEEEENGI